MKQLINGYKKFLRSLKWYEKATFVSGFLISAAGFAAWYEGPRDLHWAVEVSEPTFIGLGALSIILLWAQMRVATVQDRDTGLWNRVVSYHNFFENLPSRERAKLTIEYFRQKDIVDPPTAYKPLTDELAEQILRDRGSEEMPPGMHIITAYLNEFEQFCGAVRSGVVDDTYARELRGRKIIDTYFGWRPLIEKLRQRQEKEADGQVAKGGVEPFHSKIFLELQLLAIEWHAARKQELAEQIQVVKEANAKADAVLGELASRRGIQHRVARREETD